ncbi:MAG TPA: hypothetical protein VNB22_07465, partial [Pyrinomonadaceae bacterium]|nr:hypothetical protein [Pyrinomonadaceae bacterium]
KYLESANFDDFTSNHLAQKLIGRANEINEAFGIFPDLDFLTNLSENKAAFAVYDIGKMEFVFIAPMSEEKILASNLFQIQGNFEEIKLDDETSVYSKEIEVDRARQKQKILFTSFRGRLILATSEKYFLQTLENIKGKTPKNRLSAESSFTLLAEKTKPNLATVWLNQQKLNDDWYFKHYWLMSETENLKNRQAGMLDFEIQDKKIVEKRVFLMAESVVPVKIKAETANRLSNLIPENVPFYKIDTAEKTNFDASVLNVLFDAKNDSATKKPAQSKKNYYFNDWEKSYSYSNLDNDFGEQIDETEDEEILTDKSAGKISNDLTKIIGKANPNVSVKLFSPILLPPLFFDNRKALIFSLQNPVNLNRNDLETTLSTTAQKLFTVNNQKSEFVWTDFSIGEIPVRRMTMPSLGWNVFYALRQNELIFSNSEELLKEISAVNKNQPKFAETFDKFTVINLDRRQEIFDNIFETLEKDDNLSGNSTGRDFFTTNIGSLLDVVSDVKRIEIKQTSAQNFLFEEIDFVLKEKPE